MNQIIYRIQDENGRGPFKPGFSKNWIQEREDHFNLVPWIYEFGPVHEDVMSHEVSGCGCKTIDQLKRWFNEDEYKTLLGYGYKSVKMSVDRVLAESNIQVFFANSRPLQEGVEVFELY